MGNADRRVETYLAEVHAALAGMPDDKAADIIAELRSHIRDSAEAGGELGEERTLAALEGLGDPRELGETYVTANLVARAEASKSPLLILRTIARFASASVAAFFALLGSIIGYFLAFAVIITAISKPLHPDRAGLWKVGPDAYSLHLGFGPPPTSGTEMLGNWIIPLGLVAGGIMLLLTYGFGPWRMRALKSRSPHFDKLSRRLFDAAHRCLA